MTKTSFVLAVISWSLPALAGAQDRFVAAAYELDGTLDTTFSGDGKVMTSVWPDSIYAIEGNAVTADDTGRAIVAGHAAGRTVVVRYRLDGSLDTSFGGTGKIATDPGCAFGAHAEDDGARGVASKYGKIVAAGQMCRRAGIVRYNSDGTLDPTFGIGGFVRLSDTDPSWANAVAVDSLGRIVVVGALRIYKTTALNSHFPDEQIFIARLNWTDGSLDTTFAGTGMVFVNLYKPDSSNREAHNGNYEDATAVAIQTNGRIAVAGWAAVTSTIAVGVGTPHFNFVVLNYNDNGKPNTSFTSCNRDAGHYAYFNDIPGCSWIDMDAGPDHAQAFAIGIDILGRIVAAGGVQASGKEHFGVVRLNADGTPDSSFDGNGKRLIKWGSSSSEARALLVTSTVEGIYVGGWVDDGTRRSFALAHLHAFNGSLDSYFGSALTGKVITTFPCAGDQQINGLAFSSPAQLVPQGGGTTTASAPDRVVAAGGATYTCSWQP